MGRVRSRWRQSICWEQLKAIRKELGEDDERTAEMDEYASG